MWYVIQVRTGTEEDIVRKCGERISPAVLEKCFIPRYEERRKIQGQWQTVRKILFVGYVFLSVPSAEDIDELFLELKKVTGLTKLLGVGEDIVPLTESEVAFLSRFGGEAQVVEMSEGVIEGSQVRILSGPLLGLEGLIKKIDRHKRKAYLEVEMFGRVQRIEVGLEIAMKSVG
ncbi:MAG: antiterminator LoaP [Clostridiales bacterium]|nr:antiterminator LoaP [Clostridiales bacterium]